MLIAHGDLLLKLNPDSVSHPAFTALVDQFMEDSQGKRKEPNVSILRKHWELTG